MSSQDSGGGVGWAVPFALLGVVIGLFLAAQHLPLDPEPPRLPHSVPVLADPNQPKSAKPARIPQPQPTPVSNRPPPQSVVQKTPFDHNYALATHGATVKGGIRPELLIDGKASPYDGSLGFAYTSWSSKKPQNFVVTLKEPVTLNVVRFLLWDKSKRFYRYKLEASAAMEELGGDHWFMLADRSQAPNECRGWQVIVFRPCTVARLRLTGTYNSANASFHVVELEAYHIPGGLDFPWVEPEF